MSTKERPILMKGAMVRAILDGTKTQTRRIVKLGKDIKDHPVAGPYVEAGYTHSGATIANHRTTPYFLAHCPQGLPGDRLWVKETFALEATDKLYPWHLDGRPHEQGDDREEFSITVPHYRATDDDYGLTTEEQFDNGDTRTRWKPSLFMPRKWSRITLEVVIVRVERLNDITREDAAAEGVCIADPAHYFPGYQTNRWPEENYATLWESINGPGSWALNPWVWVIEFKRIEP